MSIPTIVREDLTNLKAKRKDHKRVVDLTSLKIKTCLWKTKNQNGDKYVLQIGGMNARGS